MARMNKKQREEYNASVVEFFLCAAKTNGAFNIPSAEEELLQTLLLSITDEMLAAGRDVTKEFILELSAMVGSIFSLFVKASGSDAQAAANIMALYIREQALQ